MHLGQSRANPGCPGDPLGSLGLVRGRCGWESGSAVGRSGAEPGRSGVHSGSVMGRSEADPRPIWSRSGPDAVPIRGRSGAELAERAQILSGVDILAPPTLQFLGWPPEFYRAYPTTAAPPIADAQSSDASAALRAKLVRRGIELVPRGEFDARRAWGSSRRALKHGSSALLWSPLVLV